MINNNKKEIEYIHATDKNGVRREIAYVYHQGKVVWELIKGFIFDKFGFAIQTKDGYIIKAKDQ